MNRQQSELIRQVREFSFDNPHEARPFSARLAEEQGWSKPFTARAIEEYRRFVILAVSAGHPVCPSDEVDEVWHLHLLYTRSYWERLCGEILGRPLHHEPSRGGPDELQKHRQMYVATLASYRRLFAAEPPADLWPPTEARFAGPAHGGTNSRRRQRRLARAIGRWPRATALGMLPLAAAMPPLVVAAAENPLNLRGKDFLALYASLFCAAVVAGIVLRLWARRDVPPPTANPPELDAYETAYLAGGIRRAVNTAIAQLVRAGNLNLVSTSPARFSQCEPPGSQAHSFEHLVYHRFDKRPLGDALHAAHRKGNAMCAPLLERLRALGLVVSRGNNALGSLVPMTALLMITGFGLVKMGVGIARDRPVAFLVIASVVTALVAVLGFGRRLHRTPFGGT